MAFRKSGAREQITTTAQLCGRSSVERKRLHVYHDRKSIDALLSAVLTDGAVVQRWIPKAITGGGPFDLRVLVIRGKIAQQVARVGRGTITNLHILAERQEVALALAKFPSSVLSDIHDICRRTAGCFPDHHAIGIDVMVDAEKVVRLCWSVTHGGTTYRAFFPTERQLRKPSRCTLFFGRVMGVTWCLSSSVWETGCGAADAGCAAF